MTRVNTSLLLDIILWAALGNREGYSLEQVAEQSTDNFSPAGRTTPVKNSSETHLKLPRPHPGQSAHRSSAILQRRPFPAYI
jgi:hypothetical protein